MVGVPVYGLGKFWWENLPGEGSGCPTHAVNGLPVGGMRLALGVDPTKDPQITVMMSNPAPKIVSRPRQHGKTSLLQSIEQEMRQAAPSGWTDELGPWIDAQLRARERAEFAARYLPDRQFDYSDYLAGPNETRMRATVLGDWTDPA